jgi:hypothetical protein
MFHKFVTQIRDQRRVVPGARATHVGAGVAMRPFLIFIILLHALHDLSLSVGAETRHHSDLPGCLPCGR